MAVAEISFPEVLVGSTYDRDFGGLPRLWSGSPVQHAGLFNGVVGASADTGSYRAAVRRTSERLAAEAGIKPAIDRRDFGCGMFVAGRLPDQGAM